MLARGAGKTRAPRFITTMTTKEIIQKIHDLTQARDEAIAEYNALVGRKTMLKTFKLNRLKKKALELNGQIAAWQAKLAHKNRK